MFIHTKRQAHLHTRAKIMIYMYTGYAHFTGSVRGGHQVYKNVSNRFIDVGLELGGKDPAYIADDADIDQAIEGVVDGGFYNAGQSCCGIERVYVHRKHYDEFLDRASTIISGYKQGNPLEDGVDMGPMAQPSSVDFLSAQVKEAKEKGARVLVGGEASDCGRFFQPTLVADATHDMGVMTEESFGPIIAVAPVDSDEEALELINDSPYGLTVSLWTNDEERAMRLAGECQTGTVFMNRCDYLEPLLAWTGVKDTGKGVSLSRHGFGPLTRLKSYHFKTKF